MRHIIAPSTQTRVALRWTRGPWSLPTHATCPFQTRRSHPVLPISLDPKINLPLPQTIIFEMGVAYVISAFMGGAARVRT